MKFFRILCIAAALTFLLCGCTVSGGSVEQKEPDEGGFQSQGGSETGTDETPLRLTAESEKIAIFTDGESPLFRKRTGRNGAPFGCVFLPENIVFAEGVMKLNLTKTQNGYGGAEYRSERRYSYGFYSVSMKAAKCSGVISSFFTYTGAPWDEIDVEFLGKDTTVIQCNYYTNGRGGHEFLYPLGFDGADDFHEYAFLWLPDSVTWYVDGKAVHTATEDIPSADTQIMMNVWNCYGNDGWSGAFDDKDLPVCASYRWIGYSPYAAEQ